MSTVAKSNLHIQTFYNKIKMCNNWDANCKDLKIKLS